jgi:hypothetical protein
VLASFGLIFCFNPPLFCPPLTFRAANENFYAIENFFYTAEFFHFLRVSPPSTFPEELATNGRQYCGLEWKEVRGMHPKVDHDELAKYCFALAFMDRWFKVGLALQAPHKNVQIVVCAR